MINNNIRQPVVEWAKNHGMLLRRLKSDRFLVVLNERIFKQIVDERFSILAQTRKASQQLDVAITLSMGSSGSMIGSIKNVIRMTNSATFLW